MKTGSHDYMEKCPYCDLYLTAEQAESHVCDIPLKGITQIPIMYLSEVKEENGDVIFLARGYDGILYRLCKTKRPMKSIRRLFTGDDDRRRLYRTRNNKPYIHVGVIFARIKRVETKWRLTITKSIW